MYDFIPMSKIQEFWPEIIEKQVSEKARSFGQFLSQYKTHGINLPEFWQKKRDAFITRSYAAYKLNPTRRRYLSLVCWAFQP